MTLREKIEDEIRIEMYWLERARKEILQEEELTEELKKYVSFAVLPRQKMNMPEYRKMIILRKILFGARQKKKMPSWIFEFMDEKIEITDRRIAEKLRADLPKKLLRAGKKK